MRGIADALAALHTPAPAPTFAEYCAQQEQLRREDEARRNVQGCLPLRASE